ncbi:Ig-like domain-containing protein [Promicromonospora sp. Populi]|uniref:Ig-like domain-containing protein n=1 Tax=Promicromonospora sp. Populi TaxID=3239420 RepID=UPI0034E25039
MRKTPARRTGLALAIALAVALTGLTTTTAEALAPGLDPADRLGAITFDVTAGNISWTGGPQRLTTEAGCPEGYRGSSRAFFIWSDGTWTTTAASQSPALVAVTAAAGTGLDGAAIDRRNPSPTAAAGRLASRWNGAGFVGDNFDGRVGVTTYLITCDPGSAPDGVSFPPFTAGVGDSKYFSTDVRINEWNDSTNVGTWEVVPDVPVEKEDTTTTLTPTAGNDGSVTLTAAVDKTAATGDVTFTNIGTGATVGTDALEGGRASVNVAGLEADTQYTFRAQYAGDTLHNASTSNDAIVTTVGEPIPPQQTEVTVTIPASAQGLRFTVTPGGVELEDAELEGEEFVATGTLREVKVTDNRSDRKQWTLNGRTSDFDGPGDAAINGSALGWEPELLGTDNAGTVGADVAPGANGGLSSDKPLAQAPAGVTLSDTRVQAGVTLRAPANTPAGDYAATLTLTLI